MRKIIFLFIFVSFFGMLVVGCGANGTFVKPVVTEEVTFQMMGYATGVGMGTLIGTVVPTAVSELGSDWKDMMSKYKIGDMVPGADILTFYNKSMLTLRAYYHDPLGLLSDLQAFLLMYGAQYEEDGTLKFISDVPYIVMLQFELGYNSGLQKADYLNTRA